MLGRRLINSSTQLRSSLSNAALAVEDRVVWRGGDAMRALAEVVRWPFERAAWAIERGLVWPLEERTGAWSEPLRLAGVAAVLLVAIGAGVFGLVWASGSGGGSAQQTQQAAAPAVAPVVGAATSKEALAQAAPVLHGAPPNFTPKPGAHANQGGDISTSPTSSAAAAETGTAATPEAATASSTGSTTAKVVPAGPAATKVAHRFAGSFVLYETGQNSAAVRAGFAATATPQLTRNLLSRPPRLPANVEVPRAKVLNVVAGPKHGDTYTLSVSLLRLGVTSELRLEMQREAKSGEWQVVRVLG
jgi:hypothetical protein